MAAAAWFEMVVGVAILGLWTFLIATHRVPELREGDRAIWFHIGAETLLGAGLLASGLLLLADDASWSRSLAAAALGGLVYSTINSSGYYARDGKWMAVASFALLTGLTLIALVLIV